MISMDIQDAAFVVKEWEKSVGFKAGVRSLLGVCQWVLFRPLDFFRHLSQGGPGIKPKRLARAILFAVILGYVRFFCDITNVAIFSRFLPVVSGVKLGLSADMWIRILRESPLFVARPVILLVFSLFFVSVGVKLLLGVNKKVFPILLVVCYKSAADALAVIPFVGDVLAVSWGVALLAIGTKEVFGLSYIRALLTSVIMPLSLVFFVLLSLGDRTLMRVMISLYPESRAQVRQVNDLSAYVSTKNVIVATEQYFQEFSFYPAHLGLLKKYISGNAIDEMLDPNPWSGYLYDYRRLDDQHFVLRVFPQQQGGFPGKLSLYADQSGSIRLTDGNGPVITGVEQLERFLKEDRAPLDAGVVS